MMKGLRHFSLALILVLGQDKNATIQLTIPTLKQICQFIFYVLVLMGGLVKIPI